MTISYRMTLNQREHHVLGMLLGEGRLKDAEIGRRLSVSTTAARKIRKGLEDKGIITGYGARSNYHDMGINVFALLFLKPASKRFKDFDEREEIEDAIQRLPNLISGSRLPQGNPSHMVFLGFREFDDLNDCLQRMKVSDPISRMEVKDMHVFSHKDIFKAEVSFLRMLGRNKDRPKVLQGIRE